MIHTDREIKGTGVAAVEANLGLLSDALFTLALGTERAVRPEPRFEKSWKVLIVLLLINHRFSVA